MARLDAIAKRLKDKSDDESRPKIEKTVSDVIEDFEDSVPWGWGCTEEEYNSAIQLQKRLLKENRKKKFEETIKGKTISHKYGTCYYIKGKIKQKLHQTPLKK